MKTRRTIAVVAATFAIGAVSACADSKSASDVADDAGSTTDAGDHSGDDGNGDSGDMSGDDTAGDSGDPLTADTLLPAMQDGMEGVTSVHVDMKIAGSAAMTASADMDLRQGDPAIDMTMNGATFSGKAHLILVDRTMYISLSSIPGGKFLAIDSRTGDPSLRASMDSLIDSASPESQFDSWDASLEEVTYVGTDTVRGDETEHYQITVNSKKALQSQGQKAPAGLPKTLTYDVWLDDESRMREVSFEIAGLTTQLYASSWGEPVDVSAPPASKVISQ
jgi:LppX_LprAFG lipoprotein